MTSLQSIIYNVNKGGDSITQDQFDKFCIVLGTTLELDIVKKFMQYLPEVLKTQ